MSPVIGEGLAAELAAGAMEAAAEETWRRFYEATARPLWAFLAAAPRDGALADDLMQESFVRLLAADFHATSEEHRRRYLFRIACNLLHDHRRAARRLAVPVEDLDLVSGEPDPERLAARRDLWRALDALKPRDRALVWLAHVEALPHDAIGELLGLGRASVRVQLFRARKRLAAQLTRSPSLPGESR